MLAGVIPGVPATRTSRSATSRSWGACPAWRAWSPLTEDEARRCVEWAVFEAEGPAYLRFVSVPWELGFEPPPPAPLELGRGTVVRSEGDLLMVCTGPVLASQAYAVESAAVVLLPWLRDIDGGWLADVAAGRRIVVLDNHWVRGGQGDAVRAALPGEHVEVIGIDRVPECGSNDEVLRAHGLDAASLRERLQA